MRKETYVRRGLTKLQGEDFKGAFAVFTKALESYPSDAKLYYLRGNVKNELKDFRGAISDFTKAIELNPKKKDCDVIYVYSSRGKAKISLEDYEGANADFSKAIKIEPTRPGIYHDRGLLKFKLDDLPGAISDFNKAKENRLASHIIDPPLKEIEERLRENAASGSKDAEESAKLLKEYFDKDKNLEIKKDKSDILKEILKDESEDEKEPKELIPLESDSFYHSLRRMIQYIPLDSSKWSAFLTLKRFTELIEDEEEEEIVQIRDAVSNYEDLERNIISNLNDCDDTDWLKDEWSIGDNKNVCAFVDRDDFMRSLTRNDHEQSKFIVQFIERCWNIACVQEKYQKWILNEEYEKINFWFFKGDIYVIDPDYGVTITFKKKDAERIFTPIQLSQFVDRDAVNIDEDCCLMSLSQITKYGDEDDYPTYSVQDLVDFWELPSDCLKYAINY